MYGKIHMTIDEWSQLELGLVTAKAVLEELYNTNRIVLVERSDKVMRGEINVVEPEEFADGQPLGGNPAIAPPGAFGNLG